MGYQVYKVGRRWGGYGVPTFCEHPGCNEEIDRGVSYACGGAPFSEHGCDRYFCSKHLQHVYFKDDGSRCRHRNDCDCEGVDLCERCENNKPSFRYKSEHPDWVKHILKDLSWKKWRDENKEEVEKMKNDLTN